MGLNQQKWPSVSLKVIVSIVPFDRPYMTSYWSSIVIMSLSCTISKMSITSQNLKRSHDHDYAHLRDYLCTKFEFSSLIHSRGILGGLKFKMGHVMWSYPFQGQFVGCRLGPDMINLHTKFEVSSLSCSKDILGD